MNLVCQWKIWGSGIFLDRSSEAGAADEGLDQHHRGASRACSKLVFFVVAFLLKSVSKRNDAWLYATSMPKDVAPLFLAVFGLLAFGPGSSDGEVTSPILQGKF